MLKVRGSQHASEMHEYEILDTGMSVKGPIRGSAESWPAGPGSCRGTRTPSTASSKPSSRANARIIDRYTRAVAGAAGRAPAPTRCCEVAAVGGDHIGVEIADHRRAVKLPDASQSPKARKIVPYCRRVLADRRPGGDPLRPHRTGCAPQARTKWAAGRGRGRRPTRPNPALETSSALDQLKLQAIPTG